MNSNYQLGLLCLSHLLISADGVIDPQEIDAFELIRKGEGISNDTYREFQRIVLQKKERDLYQHSINLINQCSDEEKLRAFAMLYKLSEVDGRVHVKEIRLLLFSIKLANVEFNDVVAEANLIPALA
jgi:uncharacterized tellurite resistance protein B-like protein